MLWWHRNKSITTLHASGAINTCTVSARWDLQHKIWLGGETSWGRDKKTNTHSENYHVNDLTAACNGDGADGSFWSSKVPGSVHSGDPSVFPASAFPRVFCQCLYCHKVKMTNNLDKNGAHRRPTVLVLNDYYNNCAEEQISPRQHLRRCKTSD